MERSSQGQDNEKALLIIGILIHHWSKTDHKMYKTCVPIGILCDIECIRKSIFTYPHHQLKPDHKVNDQPMQTKCERRQ